MTNYFTESELSCNCCGENSFSPITQSRFNSLREEAGFAMNMTSGYRCQEYNVKIGATQTHATGQAGDISCTHKQAYRLIELAPKHGFTGIGVKQKGSGRFVHLDDLEEIPGRPRPHVWNY